MKNQVNNEVNSILKIQMGTMPVYIFTDAPMDNNRKTQSHGQTFKKQLLSIKDT